MASITSGAFARRAAIARAAARSFSKMHG
jgi:hypothetical protein